MSKSPIWHLELQLLEIEDDTPNKPWGDPNFQAPADAHGSGVYFNRQHHIVLLLFFEQFGSGAPSPGTRYFTLLTKAELTALHVPQEEVAWERGNYYRYIPAPDLQAPEMVSLVLFPKWMNASTPQQEVVSAYLSFETFHQDRLRDPDFSPWYANWGGYMHFNGEAWQEFLGLYRKHSPKEPGQ